MTDSSVAAIVVAAGAGVRLRAGVPKAFVELRGCPLFMYSLRVFIAHTAIDEVVLVVPEGREVEARRYIDEAAFRKPVTVVPGGAQRWQSVRSGAAATNAAWALVHDAARPFVTAAVIEGVLAKREAFDCVITATPEIDTVRMHDGDVAGEVVDRSKLVRVGTPQLFRRSLLIDVLADAPNCPAPPTDEAMLVQRRGIPVGLASGDPLNFKVTTPADRTVAEALLAQRQTM